MVGKIQSSKGIRQGDPLSLYIFILCVDFLGRESVKQLMNLKNHIRMVIKFISLCLQRRTISFLPKLHHKLTLMLIKV